MKLCIAKSRRPTRQLLILTAPVLLSSLALAQRPVPSSLAAVTAPVIAKVGIAYEQGASSQMHLTVGHIATLNALTRVRRIYVSDPDVIDSHTISPKQIVLTAKSAGFSSVVLWDENDSQQTYTVSSDLDVSELSSAIKSAIPTESIQVSASGTRILLSGPVATQAIADQAMRLAGLFSKDVLNSLVVTPSRMKQVRLDVRIVEVDRSRLNQFGVNIFNPGGATTIGSSTTGQFPSTTTLSPTAGGSGSLVGGNTLTVSNALNLLFYSSKINVGAVVQDLENKQVLQILSEPTITTVSGQKASFLAGGEFPYPVVQGGSGGLTSITIQFRPYGVKLDFTPDVGPDGSIALSVEPEVSALDYTNAVTIDGYTIPAISTKHAETKVVLQSGQSFAISGLLDKRTTDSLSKTPGIASVPILGALFKSKQINLTTTELVVIVTPTIVEGGEGVPEVPKAPAPFLDQKKFDKSLPSAIGKQ